MRTKRESPANTPVAAPSTTTAPASLLEGTASPHDPSCVHGPPVRGGLPATVPGTPRSPARPRGASVSRPSPLAKVSAARTPTQQAVTMSSPRDIVRRFEAMAGGPDAAVAAVSPARGAKKVRPAPRPRCRDISVPRGPSIIYLTSAVAVAVAVALLIPSHALTCIVALVLAQAWTPSTAQHVLCVSCDRAVFFQERQEVDGRVRLPADGACLASLTPVVCRCRPGVSPSLHALPAVRDAAEPRQLRCVRRNPVLQATLQAAVFAQGVRYHRSLLRLPSCGSVDRGS